MYRALTIHPVSPESPEAFALKAKLRAEMEDRYPEEGAGERSNPAHFSPPLGVFLIAKLGEAPVGCAALREWRPGVAEVKRMYVAPEARRRGVSRRLLEELEAAAARLGYLSVRLEAGKRQPEALALYASAGYREIPPFGEFKHSPHSVCFEKIL